MASTPDRLARVTTDSRFAGSALLSGIFSDRARQYLESARIARLATADADGRPNAVPICFALVDGGLVTPLDEKPKSGDEDALRAKYTQYADHGLESRGTIRIEPGSVVSWGTLDPDMRTD